MNIELKIRNIVLVGLFNPLAFDRYFFIKTGILEDEKILPNAIFLPNLVQLGTPEFHFMINNVQLVITAGEPTENSNRIAEVLKRIIEIHKNLKVTGSGFNFNWFVYSDKDIKSLPLFSKEICFNPKSRLQNEFFNQDDATFGLYSSKNVLNTRLKLDIKPIIFQANIGAPEESALQFEFNFHKDYKDIDKSVLELTDILNNYSDYRKESEKIINNII